MSGTDRREQQQMDDLADVRRLDDLAVPNAHIDANAHLLTYQETDEHGHHTGRHISFAGAEFLPLQFADLVNLTLGSPVTIPLKFVNAKIVTNNLGIKASENFASGSAVLESTYSSKAIGLVRGGWLPPGLAKLSKAVVLPDRCTITDIKGRFKNGKKYGDGDDFLDFLLEPGVRINPMLYVLEGAAQRTPTPHEIALQLAEVRDALQEALPSAQLLATDTTHSVEGIIQDTAVGMENKAHFLRRIVPKLQAQPSLSTRHILCNQVLSVADECNVPRNSLVVLTVLSSILVAGPSAAKRLLKPRPSYTDADAYNALSDLRALELFICVLSLFPDQSLMLCTSDKSLALLWSGLQVHNFEWVDEHASYQLSPVDSILPDGSAQQWAAIINGESGDFTSLA